MKPASRDHLIDREGLGVMSKYDWWSFALNSSWPLIVCGRVKE